MKLNNLKYLNLRESFSILSKNDLRKVAYIIVFQVLLGFLDLIGVLTIGLLSAISIQEYENDESSILLPGILSRTPLQNLEFSTLASFLAGFGLFLLISKTIISFFFTRKIINFFSFRAAEFSMNQVTKLLCGSIELIQRNSFQHSIFAVSRGVEILFIQVLATIVVIISDISLIVVLTIGLLIIDFKTTSALVIVFGIIGWGLFRFLSSKSREQGVFVTDISVKSDEKFFEIFQLFREMKVSNRQGFYLRELGKVRYRVAKIGSELNFLPHIVKYVIELGFLIGVLVVGLIQLLMGEPADAIQSITMLIIAGSRLAPSLIRLQQGLVAVSAGLGQTKPTIDFFNDLRNKLDTDDSDKSLKNQTSASDFEPRILIRKISFSYPNSQSLAIDNLTLDIEPGSFVALVGPSGSGKSTLMDLILGVSNPSSGTISISGLTPSQCISNWPGAISYVPQDVSIINGSIWENVTLGHPYSKDLEGRVIDALKSAQLQEFSTTDRLVSLENAAEFKSKMSGGQRQRIGISRALFTNPSLIVLDESTSALDASTEHEISQSIENIRKGKTLIVIAHRLSTVMKADKIIYISEGKIISSGTFDDVRRAIPEFDIQASLMGIPRNI